MLRSLFRRAEFGTAQPRTAGRPACVPPGVCVYAIGDVHGRADLLAELHRLIEADAALLTPGTEKIAVYVGDYVDRGLESRKVIDLLIQRPLRGFRRVHLLGNHEAWLLSFLAEPSIGENWLRYGGTATLLSYGVRMGKPINDIEYYGRLQDALSERIPPRHIEFLESLALSYESGDYLFVHAGVRPNLALDRQAPEDLLWIREPFLSSRQDFGKVVVHGHTVDSAPIVRANRIGIDTGACWTGCLTCLVLEEGRHRFLSTSGVEPAPPVDHR